MLFYRREPEEVEREKMKALAETGEGTVFTGTAKQDFLKVSFQQVKRVSTLSLKELIKTIGTAERGNVDDPGVLAHPMNPLKESYQSKDPARDHLSPLLPGAKEDVVAVAACAGYVVSAARQLLCDKVKEFGMEMLHETIGRPLILVLAEMEEIGARVGIERLKAFLEEPETGIHRIETEIFEETGENFDLSSSRQFGETLSEKMKFPYGKKTKSGYSITADILEKLAPRYPVVKKILRYRMLTKLNSTHAIGFAGFIRADGRIHGTFHQTIAATGRVSSANPNLQNIPIRTEMGSRVRVVLVPSPDKVFVDVDYLQIELRILAMLSSDENLIAAHRDVVDVHAAMALQVLHVSLSEVIPLQRRSVRAVNFGVVYGISTFGLSEGLSISRNEVKEYTNRYSATYPEVKHFPDRQIKETREHGFMWTLFGRIRPVPELKSPNFMQRSFGEHVAMDVSIQGTVIDIMKTATVKVRYMPAMERLDARTVLQTHDELLAEVAEAEAPRVLEFLRETIQHAVELRALLEVDAHIGASWLEAHW